LTIFMIANAAVWKQMPLAAILILVTMKAIPRISTRPPRSMGPTSSALLARHAAGTEARD
jgi:hypothetical protein